MLLIVEVEEVDLTDVLTDVVEVSMAFEGETIELDDEEVSTRCPLLLTTALLLTALLMLLLEPMSWLLERPKLLLTEPMRLLLVELMT